MMIYSKEEKKTDWLITANQSLLDRLSVFSKEEITKIIGIINNVDIIIYIIDNLIIKNDTEWNENLFSYLQSISDNEIKNQLFFIYFRKYIWIKNNYVKKYDFYYLYLKFLGTAKISNVYINDTKIFTKINTILKRFIKTEQEQKKYNELLTNFLNWNINQKVLDTWDDNNTSILVQENTAIIPEWVMFDKSLPKVATSMTYSQLDFFINKIERNRWLLNNVEVNQVLSVFEWWIKDKSRNKSLYEKNINHIFNKYLNEKEIYDFMKKTWYGVNTSHWITLTLILNNPDLFWEFRYNWWKEDKRNNFKLEKWYINWRVKKWASEEEVKQLINNYLDNIEYDSRVWSLISDFPEIFLKEDLDKLLTMVEFSGKKSIRQYLSKNNKNIFQLWEELKTKYFDLIKNKISNTKYNKFNDLHRWVFFDKKTALFILEKLFNQSDEEYLVKSGFFEFIHLFFEYNFINNPDEDLNKLLDIMSDKIFNYFKEWNKDFSSYLAKYNQIKSYLKWREIWLLQKLQELTIKSFYETDKWKILLSFWIDNKNTIKFLWLDV